MLATAASEFKCPLCVEILPTNKGIVNHCYKKHSYSVIKGKHLNEITAGTIARPSDSGRATSAVSLILTLVGLTTGFTPEVFIYDGGRVYLPTYASIRVSLKISDISGY